ncbi:MAG TPA: AzlD domain-containing protein [Acidimicrobiia bacterium]
MSIWLLLVLAALITYSSRVATTAVLPAPEGRLGVIIERLPAPLFAALAAVALTDSAAGIDDWPVLAAVAGALAAVRTRSMFLILAAGLVSYGLVGWMVGF